MSNTSFVKEEKNGYLVLFDDLTQVSERNKITCEIPFSTKKERIDYCIEKYLSTFSRKVIRLRYGLDNDGCSKKMTFREIGDTLGVTLDFSYRIMQKICHNLNGNRIEKILLYGDEGIKELEDEDRICSHLSEFPYKIYDEDKEYIKNHYRDFYLRDTNLNSNIAGTLCKRCIPKVGMLLDADIEKVIKGMRYYNQKELIKYIDAVKCNVVSLNDSGSKASEVLDIKSVSDIMDKIDILKNQIRRNNEDAYIKQKEISDSNKERNKVLEEEIESLQSMINGKEVD